jgi:transcriptional regulator with XRE-family HTH domain
MPLSDRIRRFREFCGLSRGELAELAKVSLQSVSAWERGLWDPSSSNQEVIAAALGMDRQALLFGPLPPVDKASS